MRKPIPLLDTDKCQQHKGGRADYVHCDLAVSSNPTGQNDRDEG